MMYDQVLSNPRGGDLQDRIENYFLAWSNSIRRDLEALGVLDTPSGNDGLFGIHPADMTRRAAGRGDCADRAAAARLLGRGGEVD